MPTLDFDQLPLRQRKFARTKLALLDAMLEALRGRPLEEVTVRQLCDAVDISEASFFNYFPKKADVLTYFVQWWSLDMAWHAEGLVRRHGGLAAIEGVFDLTAAETMRHPALMAEIVAGQARMTTRPAFVELTRAERLLRFPGREGIETLRSEGLDALLPPLIERAIADGELPPHTPRQTTLVTLAALLLGLPVVLRRSDPSVLPSMYRAQLALLWAGLRAPPAERTP